MILRKPQFREFPFETQVFGRYARVKKALVNSIAESYLQGVSTRKIQEIVAHLGIDRLSPASVSWIAKDLDDQVQAFLLQPIEQATVPLRGYLLLQNSGHSTIRHQDCPGSCRSAKRWLPGDLGCKNHGSRERGVLVGILRGPQGTEIYWGSTGHLRWAYRHPEGGFSRLPRCILTD
jgi:hypothetical protein